MYDGYYRIFTDKEGLPDGIVWITLNIRNNMLHTGDIL